MQQVVTRGPFRFCSRSHLDQARIKALETSTDFNNGLTAATIAGQSYQFATPDGQTYTREEYLDHLADAYCQLGITDYGFPSPSRSGARLC